MLELPQTITHAPTHPAILTARNLLRSLLADQAGTPISLCTLPALTKSHQTIILNALQHLSPKEFQNKIQIEQIKAIPETLLRQIMLYQLNPHADLRLILIPIVILKARIIQYQSEGLPFDLTAFVTHVIADARIFGDPSDPDAWEFSDTFWDVWSGWFRTGKAVCHSLAHWRRRYGNKGSSLIEIIMGLEEENARMKNELIGKPEGWKLGDFIANGVEKLAKDSLPRMFPT